ncbi:Sensor histidine kinase WalK [Chryseobacterium aquaeductus]|uniref:histidine kinase n=1 Tax=Chryseobacterium aquaeductus TaxID=2675056 RepID=A0A9N8MFC4_9FLAO|nr:GAF domain-containing sensor histidine kinase [Chryseobacterium aquaeductus]CAA7329586.1 Sensor histidine kinase WalK [Chryseobacterium potabilaquae]CAD7797772.1 Sensor histidine kinase WalK [Chryseobacterium aquaeductus]
MIENTFGINIMPENEAERLEALKRYRITDSPSEESFDGIARLATQIFNVPISLLSLVDSESVFFKANIGMGKAKNANRGKSLCALAVLDKEVTVFEDALKEPCLMTNPNVIGDFGLRFYAGAPLITHDGFLIGTLCIIDQKTREFSTAERKILEGLAKAAMDQIELRRSALDTIDELQSSNLQLNNTQLDLESSVEELAAINEELNAANENVIKSYDLTVLLNRNLQNTEMRLKSFISKAPVAFGILTGSDLKIEVANDMILKILDKDHTIIGEPLSKALPELKGKPYLNILPDVFASGITYTGETAKIKLESEGILKDNYFDFIYEPLKDAEDKTTAIIVIANDVTESINKKRELEKLNQQLQIALHAGELGTYNLDLRTGKINSSARCKANYGLPNDYEFNFEKLMNIIVPEYREFLKETINQSIENRSSLHAEYLVRWPDESLHWISASGSLSFDEFGDATHLIGVTVDITKRKNYETQKDDFLSIASHELKTPITSLKASIQLLSKLKNNPTHQMVPKLIDQSSKSLDKLSALVDDVLNINRLSGGNLELKKEVFTVAKMLGGCCDEVRISGKHQLMITGDLEAKVFADEHRIEQVVVNFINNAVKYAPHSEEIQLIVKQTDDHVKVSVKDEGEGIDPKIQPQLFDRYFRAKHESKSYSGLGLGLYISAEIIKRHHGQIGVESTLGEGSSFWFTLPISKT